MCHRCSNSYSAAKKKVGGSFAFFIFFKPPEECDESTEWCRFKQFEAFFLIFSCSLLIHNPVVVSERNMWHTYHCSMFLGIHVLTIAQLFYLIFIQQSSCSHLLLTGTSPYLHDNIYTFRADNRNYYYGDTAAIYLPHSPNTVSVETTDLFETIQRCTLCKHVRSKVIKW